MSQANKLEIVKDWVEICEAETIPPLGARVVRTAQGDIAIFRTGNDRYLAVRDRCPHKGGALSQGIVHGDCVTCPLHNWVLNLATGEAMGPDEGAVPCFPVEVRDGQLFLGVQASSVDQACRELV